MTIRLLGTVAGCLSTLWVTVVLATTNDEPSLQEARSLNNTPPTITMQATCATWAAWMPLRSHPAVVMQAVNKDFVDVERNFIRLMELNSAFTRDNLYLMCLDDQSAIFFAAWGIRCLPLSALKFHTRKDIWKLRVKVLSCLLQEGYSVIMSDADALWVDDPMKDLELPGVSSSSIVASRGQFPRNLLSKWGFTMCMGFVMFRPNGDAMQQFHDAMERIVLAKGDDQIAVNRAALELGIVWDKDSDLRFETSVDFGKGYIASLTGGDRPFIVILLPHQQYTRNCRETPISNDTTVAHCSGHRKVDEKSSWMEKANLWSIEIENP